LTLASSSKASLEQQNVKKAVKAAETKRSPFVKINMDGIPIGRKIDLNAFNSYEKLSLAVDKLFRHLIAAQRDPGTEECHQEEVAISGLLDLDGTGEYTLVYEDYEGDRVLVGDVPWGMFVSSAKRLRVLKTSDLSSSLITSSWKRTAADWLNLFWSCLDRHSAAQLCPSRQLHVVLPQLGSREDVADASLLVTVLPFAVIPSGALVALRTVIGLVTAVTLGALSACWQALSHHRLAKCMLLAAPSLVERQQFLRELHMICGTKFGFQIIHQRSPGENIVLWYCCNHNVPK
ncbi:auxin-responsive protein IAA7-like, partial [Lolium rigidum]|uniref:auxin-responsive protein IAA7-like n=1 Tax=Lolium rigidum TaxID=89674 RepID=UPI001F5C2AEA